jgi:hypothetical protein
VSRFRSVSSLSTRFPNKAFNMTGSPARAPPSSPIPHSPGDAMEDVRRELHPHAAGDTPQETTQVDVVIGSVAERLRGLEVRQQHGADVGRSFRDLPHWTASQGYRDPAFLFPAAQDDSGRGSNDGKTMFAESSYKRPKASPVHHTDQHEVGQKPSLAENLVHRPSGGGVDSTEEHRDFSMDRTSNIAQASRQRTSDSQITGLSEGDKPSRKRRWKEIRGGGDRCQPLLPWGDAQPSREWVRLLRRDVIATRENPTQYCCRLRDELALDAYYHQSMQHLQDESAMQASFQQFVRARSNQRAVTRQHESQNLIDIVTRYRRMEQYMQGPAMHQQNLRNWVLHYRRSILRVTTKWVKPMPILA